MNNTRILLSIIIPIYNSERFITQTIESILDQPSPGIEIVAVDDGSTDRTADILDGYANQESVRVFHIQNGGGE